MGKPVYVIIANTPELTASDLSTATSWLIYKPEILFQQCAPFGGAGLVNLATPKIEGLLIGEFGEPIFHPGLGREVDTLQLGFEAPSDFGTRTPAESDWHPHRCRDADTVVHLSDARRDNQESDTESNKLSATTKVWVIGIAGLVAVAPFGIIMRARSA